MVHPKGVIQTQPPATINRTCASDDTKVLQTWLDALPANQTINFGAGCYEVLGTLWLRGFHGDTFENGTFKQPSVVEADTDVRNNPTVAPYCGKTTYQNQLWPEPIGGTVIMWWVEGGCDLTFRKMTFVGADTNGAGGGGLQQDSFIQFNGTQVALVKDVSMRGPWGDYVTASSLLECGNCGAEYPSTNITITGSTFDHSGRQGIGIVSVNKITIEHDTFGSAADTMFDIEVDCTTCNQAAGTQDDILIQDNTLVGQHYAFVLAAQTAASIDRLQFTGNQLTNGAQMRIIATPQFLATNIRIYHNVATGVDSSSGFSRPAIQIANAGMVEVDDNTIPLGKAGLAKLPVGSVECQNNGATPACPSPSPIAAPAVAVLP